MKTSSIDPFEFFGLNREDATERDIKTAYATRLKSIRPDDDRQEFIDLRTAFENARAELQWRAQYGDETIDHGAFEEDGNAASIQCVDENQGSIEEIDASVLSQQLDPESAQAVSDASPVEKAMRDLEELTKSPFAGASFDPWKAIVERDELQPIDEFLQLSNLLQWSVCDATGISSEDQNVEVPDWLSLSVFRGLCEHFGWHRQQHRDQWSMAQLRWLGTVEQFLTAQVTNNDFEHRRSRRARRRGHRVTPVIPKQPSLFQVYQPARAAPTPEYSDRREDNNGWQVIWMIFWIIMTLSGVWRLFGAS